MKNTIPIAWLLACLFLASSALAGDYWPVSGEFIYRYENSNGEEMTVEVNNGERITSTGAPGSTGFIQYESFVEEANGDVLLRDYSFSYNHKSGPDMSFSLNPPAMFLDLPLEVDKSWMIDAQVPGGLFGPPVDVMIVYRVDSEVEVTVPYGTFPTMVLLEMDLSTHGRDRTYYLNKDIGPVMINPGGWQLKEIEGATPTSESAWGSLKALYR